MQQNLKTDILAFVAAVCIVISALFSMNIISLVIDIAFAVFLILSTSVIREKCGVPIKKKARDLGFTIAGGVLVLLQLIYLLFFYFWLYSLLGFLSAAILFLLILENCMSTLLERTPALEKVVDTIDKIWFVPAILQVIICFNCILLDMVSHFFLAIAFFFMALWLRSPDKIGDEAYIDSSKQKRQSSQNNAFNGGADQLKIYKDLLDSGAITQEEFDAKKKEILGNFLS